MEASRLAGQLADIFVGKQYQWKVDGCLTVPDYDDFLSVFETVKERLKEEPEGTWLETGRLIFIKDTAGLDVYVLQGTLGEDDTSKDEQ